MPMKIIDECRGMAGEFLVYEIRFANKKKYVGKSDNSRFRDRMSKHETKPSRRLAPLMRSDCPRAVHIVAKHFNAATQQEDEALRIAVMSADESLNSLLVHRWGIGSNRRPGKRNYPRLPNGKPYRCSLCREKKLSQDFWSDRNRSSGLSSKCIDCQLWMKRRFSQLKREGDPTPWQTAKKERIGASRENDSIGGAKPKACASGAAHKQ